MFSDTGWMLGRALKELQLIKKLKSRVKVSFLSADLSWAGAARAAPCEQTQGFWSELPHQTSPTGPLL